MHQAQRQSQRRLFLLPPLQIFPSGIILEIQAEVRPHWRQRATKLGWEWMGRSSPMGQRHLTAVSWPSSECYIAALQIQQQFWMQPLPLPCPVSQIMVLCCKSQHRSAAMHKDLPGILAAGWSGHICNPACITQLWLLLVQRVNERHIPWIHRIGIMIITVELQEGGRRNHFCIVSINCQC